MEGIGPGENTDNITCGGFQKPSSEEVKSPPQNKWSSYSHASTAIDGSTCIYMYLYVIVF